MKCKICLIKEAVLGSYYCKKCNPDFKYKGQRLSQRKSKIRYRNIKWK